MAGTARREPVTELCGRGCSEAAHQASAGLLWAPVLKMGQGHAPRQQPDLDNTPTTETQTASTSKATPGTSPPALPPPPRPRPKPPALPAPSLLPPSPWSISWRCLFPGPPPPGTPCHHPLPLTLHRRPARLPPAVCSHEPHAWHGPAQPPARPLGRPFPPMTCLLTRCLSLATAVLPGRERGDPLCGRPSAERFHCTESGRGSSRDQPRAGSARPLSLEGQESPRPLPTQVCTGVGVREGGDEACALSSPGRGDAMFRK
ncbi:hypothetical protein PAL_GLEAN10002946 [Pteropus alecto]|uniref:Uncharacterized protein n=1 Tax=Pteropus alecto TaxID=9402 RepID=L5JW87_PTEAL|nr:hypothetical protein PAL_GLEAN10002946 [Pteropus alecto]